MQKHFLFSAFLFSLLTFLLLNCGKKKEDPTPGSNNTTGVTIASINPTSGAEGTKVVITGTGFSTALSSNIIKFGTISATVDSATATRLVTKVPQGTTTGKITVEVGGKTATSSSDFTIAVNPPVTTTTPTLDNSANATGSSDITATSAKVSSTLSANGGAAISQHGHVWSETNATPTTADTKTELGATNGPFPLRFTSELKSLKANTTYNIRAYATNDKGTSYGAVIQTKTSVASTITLSTLTQAYVNWVTDYSIQFSSISVKYPQGSKLTDMGFCYSETKPQPTTDDPKLNSTPSSTGATNTFFEAELTGLKTNANYNVRAFAIVDGVTFYSNVLQVSTKSKLSNAAFTRRANFPGTFQSRAIQFSLGGKFYTGTSIRAENGSNSPTGWYEYDPATDKWTQKNNVSISSGSYQGGSSGVMYVANGKGYFGLSTGFTAQKELWEYDPASDKWVRIAANLTNPLGLFTIHSQIQINTKVYLIGQELGTNSVIRFYEYDITTRTFTQKAVPSGTSNSFNGLVGLNNTVYFYNLLNKTSFAQYNAGNDTWTNVSAGLPTSSNGSYGVQLLQSAGGKLYALGQETFEYEPSSSNWKSIFLQSYADRLTSNQSFILPDRMFVGMGTTTPQWLEFKP